MPCYDGRAAEDNARDAALYNETAKKKVQLELDLEDAKTEIKLREAMLCAVLTESTNEMTQEEYTNWLNHVEKNSGCPGINDFWEKHLIEDTIRMNDIAKGLSIHEKAILKEML